MNNFELIKKIGLGTFGTVYEAINKETKEKVAIKILKEKFESLSDCLAKKEIRILQKIHHENIVLLKDVIREKTGEASMIFEYCDCNLFQFIENHRVHKKLIPEPIIREIIFQITKGIKHMHSNKYFHRDLKPENILVILNNYNLNNINNEGELKIKIADFGTVKEIPLKNNTPMTDYVCTRWYRAPECVLRAENYDEKIDVWAIGCIMAELYNLGPIFPGENEFDQINQILKVLGTPTRGKWPWGYYQAEMLGFQFPIYYKKDFKNYFEFICNEGINLLNEILQFDSTKRPSCNKILNHPFFKFINKIPINCTSMNLRNSKRKHIISSNGNDNKKTKNIIKNIKLENFNLNNTTNALRTIPINIERNNNIKEGENKDNNNRNFSNSITNHINNTKENDINVKIKNKKSVQIYYYNKDNLRNNKELSENNKKEKKNLIIIKRNVTQKSSNKNINVNNYNSITNINNIIHNYPTYSNNKNYNSRNNITHNNINISSKNNESINDNINSIVSIKKNNKKGDYVTEKGSKYVKYIKLNEKSLDNSTTKIMRYTKNKKEEIKNNEIYNNKKELKDNKFKRIVKNGNNYLTFNNDNNNSKKFYFVQKVKEDKEDLISKSIETLTNSGLTNYSSNKSKYSKGMSENNKINNIKKLKNYKLMDNFNNRNSIEKTYKNHKSHYINCNKVDNNQSNNDNNSKAIYSEKSKEKNYEKNKEDNIIKLSNNIVNSSNFNNKDKKHHRFYESNGGSSYHCNYVKNNNYHSYNGYNNYQISSNNSISNHSLGRNSTTKNILFNQEEKQKVINTYNMKLLGDSYMNNNTPKKDTNENQPYKITTLSPIKNNEQNTLFSSLYSKNNGNFLFGKSQSLFKSNNNSLSKTINYKDNFKINNDDNCKNKVKVVNINLVDFDHSKNKNYYFSSIKKNNISNYNSRTNSLKEKNKDIINSIK